VEGQAVLRAGPDDTRGHAWAESTVWPAHAMLAHTWQAGLSAPPTTQGTGGRQ
jgi:hypothetical protein